MSDEQSSGIFDGFEEYRVQQPADLSDALTDGLVTLDANVLLNLYKLDPETRDTWLVLLERLTERSDSLWVSNQAVREFWNNRTAAAMHPEVATRAKDEIERARALISKQFRSWSRTLSGGSEVAVTTLEPVNTAIDAVVRQIDDFIEQHEEQYSESPSDDVVVQRLETILNERVGPAPDDSTLAKLHRDGELRFAKKIPPGYLDSEKGTDKRYGDYVLWEQILEECARRGSGFSRKVLIVTADGKADWWRRSFGGNENIGPRLELSREARDRAGVSVMLIAPAGFLELLGHHFEVEVDQRMIDSTSEAGGVSVDQQWAAIEVQVVIERLENSLHPHLVDVLRAAAGDENGTILREDIHRIVGGERAHFRRFSLPIRTQTMNAAQAGEVSEDLPNLLEAVYPPVGGNLTGYRIPSESVAAVREAFALKEAGSPVA